AGLRDGRVALVARRESPAEELAVRFEAVLRATAYAPTDERDPSVSGTEADLTERLLADPDRLEPGFRPLATERETPVGAVDIYGEDAEGRRVVVEVKRRRAGPDAVGQLRRYVAALRRDLHAETELRGVLVAPSATDRARELLAAEGLEFVPLEP
ncbi:MAG: endonuclease NucS domain-containing protein, partial [Halorientalis sp.]